MAACIHSGIPYPGDPEDTSRLLYELFPLSLRNEAAAARHAGFVAQQAGLYQQVLEDGAAAGQFDLRVPAPFIARSLVALENGYGIEVASGLRSPEDVEHMLQVHAPLMTGTSGGSPDSDRDAQHRSRCP